MGQMRVQFALALNNYGHVRCSLALDFASVHVERIERGRAFIRSSRQIGVQLPILNVIIRLDGIG